MGRPSEVPTDPWQRVVYDQYPVAMGSALMGFFMDGFFLAVVILLWGYWATNFRRKDRLIIQLTAVGQERACPE